MPFPIRLKEQLLRRFDALIQEGQEIREGARPVEGRPATSKMTADPRTDLLHHEFDWQRLVVWRTRCVTLLGPLLPGTAHDGLVPHFKAMGADVSSFEMALGSLVALRADLSDGMLDSMASRIEAELVGDLMGQAESLLGDQDLGSISYVPAAVLARAVLERSMRSLAAVQTPPVATTGPDGKPLKLSVMIDSLKKAGAFNETLAKQLRAWSSIGNECAHGHTGAVDRNQVAAMISGVGDFLAKHLG